MGYPVKMLAFLDLQSWRLPTYEELHEHFAIPARPGAAPKTRKNSSTLVVRKSFSTVDMFSYLKARFGEPNGFMNVLRSDTSDNWIHWDFALRSHDVDIWVQGASREVRLTVAGQLTDENWRDLLIEIKADFKRVAKEKSAVLKTLEQWVIFPNKFVEIEAACVELHSGIVENLDPFKCVAIAPMSRPISSQQQTLIQEASNRAKKLYKDCLVLSLLTPVLAEAFLNLTILMLCKKDIRDNKRQFDAFIRSNIDTKFFDLAYKCEGFLRPIDPNADPFKKFMQVMAKRNHRIHGNCNPEQEQLEVVYFEGTKPLFKEPGDSIGRFIEAQARQHDPEAVIKDYKDIRGFISEVINCLDPNLVSAFRLVMADPYPGYDVGRKKMGSVLPKHIVVGSLKGDKHDDELEVTSA